MNNTTKKAACLALAAAMVASMAACGSSSSSTASSSAASTASSAAASSAAASTTAGTKMTGGTLTLGIRASLNCLGYPGKLSTTSEQLCVWPCLESLCRYDENGVLQPWLLESYKEDEAAGTLVMTVRQGIKFHDGSDLNAEVVVYNLEKQIATRKTTFSCGEIKIEKTGDYEVTVTMPTYAADVLDSLTNPSTDGIVASMEYLKQHEDDVETAYKTAIGTGPYKFVSWDGDTKIVYEKNENYWGGTPNLDKIVINTYSDTSTLNAAYQSGEIDGIMQATRDTVTTLNAPLTGGFLKTGMMVKGIAITANEGCGLPTENLKVRQAIAYAIDWKTLAATYDDAGFYEYCNEWATPGSVGWNDSVVGYEYNVDKAKELLKEAGYANGFELNAYYNATNSEYQSDFTIMQQYLAAVGITLNLNPVEQSVQNEITANGWDGICPLSQGNNISNARNLGRVFDNTSGARYACQMVNIPEVKELANQALKTSDVSKRGEYEQQIQKIIVDDYCAWFSFSTYAPAFIMQDYVKDTGFGETHQVQWTPESVYMTEH